MKAPIDRLRLLLAAAASLASADGASAQAVTADLIFGVSRAHYLAEHLRAAPSGGVDQWVPVWSGARIGPVLGAGVSAPLVSRLSLRGEVLLVRKGLSSASVVLDEGFLEIPMLVQLEMPWRGSVRFRVVAGVAPSRELWCRAEVAPPIADLSEADASDLVRAECEDFRTDPGDIGNVLGAGFGPLELAGLSLMPELRVVVGGADLLAERRRERARHRTLSLLVAVRR